MTAVALYLAAAAAGLAVHAVATLVFFAAICRLQQLQAAGGLTRPLRAAYIVVLVLGYLLDAALNLAATLVFWRLPRDALLTGRLIRYKREGVGWRCRLAVLVCEQLLDPLDPSGCHCKV